MRAVSLRRLRRKPNIVYKINSRNYEKHYVGPSGCTLRIRLYEHQPAVKHHDIAYRINLLLLLFVPWVPSGTYGFSSTSPFHSVLCSLFNVAPRPPRSFHFFLT
ncbi:unnamed protein product [Heterobilharzia americana]|nr:unnamed protein product [Heterobilharzia americana]